MLNFNDEQRMIRDNLRQLLTSETPVSHLRALRNARSSDGISPALWKTFGELGFAGVLVPEEFGGLGLSLFDATIVAEEYGHTLTPSPFLSTSVMATTALVVSGNTHLMRRFLPEIALGRIVMACAIDTGPHHDPRMPGLGFARSGATVTANGTKTFVVDGHIAETVLVTGFLDGEMTVAAVARDTPGVTVRRQWMMDAHNSAALKFEDVQLNQMQLLSDPGKGRDILDAVLAAGRIVVAAELIGLADEVLSRTIAYLKERHQFGRPIGSFQALQHRAALQFAEIELARAAVLKAARAVDEGAENAELMVSVAKAKAGEAALGASEEAVQMHGGIGITDDLDIGLFLKRARVADHLLGNAHYHVTRVAALTGY